jgi:hypothetical protein
MAGSCFEHIRALAVREARSDSLDQKEDDASLRGFPSCTTTPRPPIEIACRFRNSERARLTISRLAPVRFLDAEGVEGGANLSRERRRVLGSRAVDRIVLDIESGN